VREAPYATARGKYDCIIGSPGAAAEVAAILKFG
jgi:hypothetical protein